MRSTKTLLQSTGCVIMQAMQCRDRFAPQFRCCRPGLTVACIGMCSQLLQPKPSRRLVSQHHSCLLGHIDFFVCRQLPCDQPGSSPPWQ